MGRRRRVAPGGAALARTVAVAVAAMAALPGTLGKHQCPDQPPCSHCHAAQGKCPNTNEGGLCQAACDEGWYATNTWTANGGFKDGYVCSEYMDHGWKYRWDLPTKAQGGNGHGLDCRPLCPAAPPIPHAAACPEATRQQNSPANSQAGGPCTLDCAAGYIRKGSAAFTCQTRCTANCGKGGQEVYESTWEASGGDTATCEPLTCPAAPPVEDARPCAAGSYGERCEATCKPGYRARGDSGDPPYAYTCAATGLWEGGSLACEPIPDWCPSFTGGSPGVIPRPSEQCALAVGSVCAAACAEGWERESGDDLYTCVAGEAGGKAGGDAGTWVPTRGAGTELKCWQLCPVSEDGGPIKGSHFLPGCELFAGGQPCTAQCNDGYSSSGEPTYTCSKQAKWTGGSLKCGLTGCADETTLENGTKCESGNIGDKCTPSCSHGYSGTGSAEYTCTAQHKWNSTGDHVHCTAAKDWCPRDAIAELNVEITGECDGAVGTVCAVQCAAGSERVRGNLEKDQKYSCQANKEWQPVVSKDLLVCERMCDTAAVPSEEHALMRSDCKGTPRRYCLATCKKGYKQQEGGNPEFLCAQTEDGTQGVWEEGSIVCERSCDPGTAPAALDARNKTLRCDSCDAGRFSPAGTGCLDCAQPNENQTLCLRCGAGHGLSDDKTVCEECARTALVEKDGKCVAPKPSPNKIAQDAEDWFMRESPAGKGLTIGIPLVGIVLICCCVARLGRQPREPENQEGDCFYVEDVVVFAVVTALVVAAIVWYDDSHDQDAVMIRVCVVASALSWLPVPHILRRFKRTLAELKPISLSEESSHLGFVGVCMFAWGLLDFVRGPMLCVSLGRGEHWALLLCCTATLVVTTVITGHLAFTVLDEVKKTPAAATWVAEHDKLVACIGIAASSRLDMIAIFRLKLRGKVRCGLPMEDKHFHFCRHAGMYHYLIEDMPHLLIAMASLDCEKGKGAKWYHLGLDATSFAFASAGLSACSIFFGLVNKAVQMRIASVGDTSSVPLLPDVNTAMRDYISSLQEENRQLREHARAPNTEQALSTAMPRDSDGERS